DLVRAVQVLHAGVALDAVGGHLLAPEEWLLDELDVLDVSVLVEEVPVRGLDAVDRRSLPAVTRRAPELLGRMLAEVELAPGVRLPRVPLVLEAGLVDAGVARHAAVDARDRLVEVVAIELLEHELLDLGDLRLPVEAEERRAGLRPGEVAERYALELLPEVVARRRQLGERILRRLHRALERLHLVLQVLDVRLRLAVYLLALGTHQLLLLDLVQQRLGRAAVVERVVVFEAQLLELALHEPEIEVLLLVLMLRLRQFALDLGDLPRTLARGAALLRVLERLGRGLVLGIGVEAVLLGLDRVLEPADL